MFIGGQRTAGKYHILLSVVIFFPQKNGTLVIVFDFKQFWLCFKTRGAEEATDQEAFLLSHWKDLMAFVMTEGTAFSCSALGLSL